MRSPIEACLQIRQFRGNFASLASGLEPLRRLGKDEWPIRQKPDTKPSHNLGSAGSAHAFRVARLAAVWAAVAVTGSIDCGNPLPASDCGHAVGASSCKMPLSMGWCQPLHKHRPSPMIPRKSASKRGTGNDTRLQRVKGKIRKVQTSAGSAASPLLSGKPNHGGTVTTTRRLMIL